MERVLECIDEQIVEMPRHDRRSRAGDGRDKMMTIIKDTLNEMDCLKIQQMVQARTREEGKRNCRLRRTCGGKQNERPARKA